MKRYLRHVKSRVSANFKRFSKKLRNLKIKLFILELIQSILKKIIDGRDGPVLLPLEPDKVEKKEPPKIFNKKPIGDKMTDREKLMKIEEALHKMRDNYRKIRANKNGGVHMYTNKDVGELVCKDLDKLFKYMQELEVKQ